MKIKSNIQNLFKTGRDPALRRPVVAARRPCLVFVRLLLCFILLPSAFSLSAFAQGTAFTYQGQLQNNGSLASGSYDLTFTLFATNTGGVPIALPVTNSAAAVSNGLFTTTIDFGPGAFTGGSNWLEIAVSSNGANSFTTLAPRQQLTPVPYAIMAENVSGGGLASGTYGNAVTFNNAANSFTGSYSGNGGGLTNLNAATLGGLAPGNFWQTDGNAGTTAGVNFVGTTDNQPLEMHVNGGRVLRLEPDTLGAGSPNVIGGSPSNVVATSSGATIAGGGKAGLANSIGSGTTFATIGGGQDNTNNSSNATVAGGTGNLIQTNAADAMIGGGSGNGINTGAHDSTIAGGINNGIQTNSSTAFIGGGRSNTIQTNTFGSVIAGGRYNTIQAGSFSVLADSAIGGGFTNTIQANSSDAVISGGSQNTIQTNAFGAVIAGDRNNTIQANSSDAVISGGFQNTIQTNAFSSVIAGGGDNTIQVNAPNSVVAGGNTNIIQTGAFESAIGGGANNTIQSGAVGSWIGGGNANLILSGARFAAIPAGSSNTAASDALAAGSFAQATNNNAFVWSDGSATTGSLTNNTVTMRATNGFSFFTGNGTAGAQLAPGATAWSVLSDRNAKKNFAPVHGSIILEKLARVPIEQWNYKWEADSDVPHIGPMAQDFKAAFYPGDDDKSISTLEFDGVELAAIQGLNRKLDEKDARIQEQAAQIASLKARLDKLEQMMNARPADAK